MKIFLTDCQKWVLVTQEEAKRIINANLEEYTKLTIQPYLLY